MYCRNCLREGKKVNMDVLVEEEVYICPKCGNRVEWNENEV
jgi:DNA-directed RNA polymerase subunit RPC12/RpoP